MDLLLLFVSAMSCIEGLDIATDTWAIKFLGYSECLVRS